MRIWIGVLLVLVGLSGCKPSESEIVSYVLNPENGLMDISEEIDYNLEVKYVPSIVTVVKERKHQILQPEDEARRLKDLDKFENYELLVSAKEGSLETESINIKMIQGKDVLPIFFHIENVGASNMARVLVSFSRKEINRSKPRKFKVSLIDKHDYSLEILNESINEFEEIYIN